jgi:hypothetical protein
LTAMLPSMSYPFFIKNGMVNQPITITLSIPNTIKTDKRVLTPGKIIGFALTKAGQDYLAKGGAFRLQKYPDVNPDMSRSIDASTINTYFLFRDDGASLCDNAQNLSRLGEPMSPIFDGFLIPQFFSQTIDTPWCAYPK